MYKSDEALYKNTGNSILADKLSVISRNNTLRLFFKRYKINSKTKVLDLGVSNFNNSASTNFFLKSYPYPKQLTCCGIHSAQSFTKNFPGMKYVTTARNKPLPFNHKTFDITFSNAVLEHVGTRAQQEEFVSECIRVAKKIFIVFPNRLFPIEQHTLVPLIHWLPRHYFRSILLIFKMNFWAQESNLNHLDKSFIDYLCKKYNCKKRYTGLKLGAFSSNIVIFN
jgi:SAM-dependent methyltransferase